MVPIRICFQFVPYHIYGAVRAERKDEGTPERTRCCSATELPGVVLTVAVAVGVAVVVSIVVVAVASVVVHFVFSVVVDVVVLVVFMVVICSSC